MSEREIRKAVRVATPEGAHVAEEIELEFGRPRHGWLPVRLRLDGFTFVDSDSNVLNDPLEEFLAWTELLMHGGHGPSRLCLWLEPAGYALDLRILDAKLAQVYISSGDCIVPPATASDLKLELDVAVDREILLGTVENAVSALFSSARSAVEEHWLRNPDSRCGRMLSGFRAEQV